MPVLHCHMKGNIKFINMTNLLFQNERILYPDASILPESFSLLFVTNELYNSITWLPCKDMEDKIKCTKHSVDEASVIYDALMIDS